MGMKNKTGKQNISAGSPAGGKKLKSRSGDWDVGAKKIPDLPGNQEADTAKFDSGKFSPNQVKKRGSLNPGGHTSKKQKTGQDSSGVGPTPKKQKARKRQKSKDTNSSASSNVPGAEKQKEDFKIEKKDGIKQETINKRQHNFRPQKSNVPNQCAKQDAFPGWNAGDLLKLIGRIEDMSSELLSMKTEDALNQIKWEKIAFEPHTAKECQVTWVRLQEKSRGTRELIDEVRKMLVQSIPKKARLPKHDVKGTSKDDDDSDEIEDEDEEEEEEEEEDEEEQGGEVLRCKGGVEEEVDEECEEDSEDE